MLLRRLHWQTALAKKMPKLHKAALNRFYIDDAWQFFTHKIVFGLLLKANRMVRPSCHRWYLQLHGLGCTGGRRDHPVPWQSGDVRSYAIWFLTGTVALTLCLLALL